MNYSCFSSFMKVVLISKLIEKHAKLINISRKIYIEDIFLGGGGVVSKIFYYNTDLRMQRNKDIRLLKGFSLNN